MFIRNAALNLMNEFVVAIAPVCAQHLIGCGWTRFDSV